MPLVWTLSQYVRRPGTWVRKAPFGEALQVLAHLPVRELIAKCDSGLQPLRCFYTDSRFYECLHTWMWKRGLLRNRDIQRLLSRRVLELKLVDGDHLHLTAQRLS